MVAVVVVASTVEEAVEADSMAAQVDFAADTAADSAVAMAEDFAPAAAVGEADGAAVAGATAAAGAGADGGMDSAGGPGPTRLTGTTATMAVGDIPTTRTILTTIPRTRITPTILPTRAGPMDPTTAGFPGPHPHARPILLRPDRDLLPGRKRRVLPARRMPT